MGRLYGPVIALLVAVLLCLGGGVQAQLTQQSRETYDEWLKTAQRAEEAIGSQRASNAAFEQLRADINAFREKFNSDRARNSDRIRTLESQLKALGPKPGEGESEPQDIAELRALLETQLSNLRVPRIIAEEAFSRANGLISEIDRIIRDRQTRKLTSRGPSPVNPEYWSRAIEDIKRGSEGLVAETVENTRSRTVTELINNRLPAIVVLLVLGLVFLFMGRRWSERLGRYLRSFGGQGSGVWSFVISLTRILVPWLGTVAIVQAIAYSGIPGTRGSLILAYVPQWAAILLVFDWIAKQMVQMRVGEAIGFLSPDRPGHLRFHFRMFALMLVLHELVKLFEQIENIPDTTRAFASFPLIVLTGILLMRFLKKTGDREQDQSHPDTSASNLERIIELIRRTFFLFGALSPVIAAFGYVFAAEAIVYPSVTTLALLATLLILQRFIGNVYGWISGQSDDVGDTLFAVLVGFILAILSLPVLALIWGARLTDLTELWSRFLLGFDIGGVQLSPENFLVFAIIFIVGYTLTRLLQGGLRTSLLPKTGIDPGGQNAIVAGTGYVGIFLSALVAITGAGFDLSSLAIVAGALSIGIGFGLQTIVSNFVSGIILLIERPISKGDWIEVGGMMGYVADISVRSTRIETFDRTDVIVPNSDLISGTVTNYTRGNTIGRLVLPVGVAYGTDTSKVDALLRDIATAHPMVLANPAPNVVFQGFGADSLDFEIRAILRDVNWLLTVKSEINHEIAKRFAEEGIEIPFPQRDIWLRNPEVLPGAAEREAPASTEMAEMTVEDMETDADADPDAD